MSIPKFSRMKSSKKKCSNEYRFKNHLFRSFILELTDSISFISEANSKKYNLNRINTV